MPTGFGVTGIVLHCAVSPHFFVNIEHFVEIHGFVNLGV